MLKAASGKESVNKKRKTLSPKEKKSDRYASLPMSMADEIPVEEDKVKDIQLQDIFDPIEDPIEGIRQPQKPATTPTMKSKWIVPSPAKKSFIDPRVSGSGVKTYSKKKPSLQQSSGRVFNSNSNSNIYSSNNASLFYGHKSNMSPHYGGQKRDYFASFVRRSMDGDVGLRNLGNTCYINSSLQALLTFKSFINEVCDETTVARMRSVTESGASLYDTFYQLVQKIKGANEVVSPQMLKIMIGENNARFIGNAQEDAHEFISTLLNTLDDEFQQKLKEENGPSHKFFSLAVEHALVCSKCGHKKIIEEEFLDLSLELTTAEEEKTEEIVEDKGTTPEKSIVIGKEKEEEEEVWLSDFASDTSPKKTKKEMEEVDLKDLVAHFLSVEEGLEWKCPKQEQCGSNEGTMEHHLSRLPRILMLHLKRFWPNLETNRFDKFSVPVNIPEQLDLNDFVVDKIKGQNAKYQLRAIITHIGATINSGHFICHSKKENGKFYRYNDSIVSDSNEMDSFKGEKAKKNAYILFFERMDKAI